MKKIPVVVIDKDQKTIDRIIGMLENMANSGNIKYSNSIYDIEVILVKKTPILVIVGPSFELSDIEELVSHYSKALSNVRIVLLARDLSSDLLKSALRFNIHDVLEYPFNEKDLVESFKRAEEVFGEAGETGNVSSHECSKIMFFSTKGGSGNSVLAINFAVALKNRTRNKNVTVFDLNYQFGDVALMLNIYPKNTIFDLMGIGKYDDETLDIFLTTHNSGLKILPSPIDPSQGETISVDVTLKVFEALGRASDYLVIDAPFGFSEEVLSLIEKIDYVFLVATKDVPSIKNLKICLQLLERLRFPRERIFIVLNRSDSKVDIDIDEIEKTIQRKVDIKVPSDRMVPLSVNKGSPVVLGFPRLPLSKSIQGMVDILLPLKEKVKIK